MNNILFTDKGTTYTTEFVVATQPFLDEHLGSLMKALLKMHGGDYTMNLGISDKATTTPHLRIKMTDEAGLNEGWMFMPFDFKDGEFVVLGTKYIGPDEIEHYNEVG